MALNGAVAFGAALAGGALAGPMGAFMALPIAALITAFVSNFTTSHEIVYGSPYDKAADDDGTHSETTEEVATDATGGPHS